MGKDVIGLRLSSVNLKPSSERVFFEGGEEISHRITSEGIMEVQASPVKAGNDKAAHNQNGCIQQDVLGVKSTNVQGKNAVELSAEEVNPRTPEKPESKFGAVDSEETKHVVEKPVNCCNDNCALVTPKSAEVPVSGDSMSPNAKNGFSPCSSKKSQPSTYTSGQHFDDEDNWSMTSSTAASVRTARSRTTVAVAPRFSINNRLEKRKEFYAKLGEKHLALEAEKREYEARSKEEQEAAIKQLRKNMVVKANPVPKFYYEGPPAKKEPKKLPTTRPVSPKFGRRKSCGDAATTPPLELKAACSIRVQRHSLGSSGRRDGSTTPASTYKKKSSPNREHSGGKTVSSSSKKEHPKKEASPQHRVNSTPQTNKTKQPNGDITVQS